MTLRTEAALRVSPRRRAMERRGGSVNPDGHHGEWQGRALHSAAHGFGCAMRAIGLYGRGRANALSPHLVEHTFHFRDLPPAFDGYRILHISDPHLDWLPELGGIGRRLLAEVSVDLVAVTGDIHGAPRAPLARSTLPLAELLAGPKVRDRVVAVLDTRLAQSSYRSAMFRKLPRMKRTRDRAQVLAFLRDLRE